MSRELVVLAIEFRDFTEAFRLLILKASDIPYLYFMHAVHGSCYNRLFSTGERSAVEVAT